MDNIHFTLNHLLPYQRNFNFVNGIRSIGKTYGSYYYFIDQWRKNKTEFAVICRTQDEKKNGYLEKAVQKVLIKEFPDMVTAVDVKDRPLLQFNKDKMTFGGQTVGHCIALSEAIKIKKNAYPNVKYILFDEYAIEEDATQRYVNGWNEPDLFLSVYHTIDREEDRVICFCMGNNISAYNPYHLHPAFKIPYTEPGNIYKSENVLFENAIASAQLQEKKAGNKFLRMIEGTEYGAMASEGKYIYDSDKMVKETTLETYQPMFTLVYNGRKYGIWRDRFSGTLLISDKYNPTHPYKYGITKDDVDETTRLAQRTNGRIGYFATCFRMGMVYFNSMEIKKRFAEVMPYVI